MRKNLLLLSISLVVVLTNVVAQTKKVETFYDANKTKLKEIYTASTTPPYLKQGNYKKYNENTKLIQDYNYSNGELNGTCITYFVNGQIKTKYIYKNGIKHGAFVDNDNQLGNFTGIYVNDKLDGIHTRFNKTTGITEFTATYSNGKLNGVYRTFYPDGKIETATNYYNDQPKGEYIEYYKNGKIRIEAIYENGMKNGVYKKYYESGQFEMEANFVNDKMNGLIKTYYDHDKLKQAVNMLNEVKDGNEKVYSENGFWELTNEYKAGEMLANNPVKVNSDNAQAKEFCEKSFFSFGSAIATEFKFLGETDQMRLDYRIARDFENDSMSLVIFNISPKDPKFKSMIACTKFVLKNQEGKYIMKFDCGGQFLADQEAKQVTVKLGKMFCTNLNKLVAEITLTQISVGNCGNEEGMSNAIANAYGQENTFTRKNIIVKGSDSELFTALLRASRY